MRATNNASRLMMYLVKCVHLEVFAFVESCPSQVMASIHISSLHMVSKVTTGPSMNLHSTIMKGVTATLQLSGCC